MMTTGMAYRAAMGAAIASNCEPCFRSHFDRARKLGVAKEDMTRAVRTAQSVKESPARAILGLAERYLEATIASDLKGKGSCSPPAAPPSPTPTASPFRKCD